MSIRATLPAADGEDAYTVTLNSGYSKFIKKLRERLQHKIKETVENREVWRKVYSHDLPVLPPLLADGSYSFFEFPIGIREGGREWQTDLLIRRQDVYLVGYKRGDMWYEFNMHGGVHIKDDSDHMAYWEGYRHLGLGNHISFGYHKLKDAIIRLAETEIQEEKKEPLLVVIFMICEACRIEEFSKEFGEKISKKESEAFTPRMALLVHKWETLCEDLQLEDLRSEHVYYNPKTEPLARDESITCGTDAAKCLEMLKATN